MSKEEKFQLELEDKPPEFLKDELEDGDMLLKARSLHESFLEEPWMSKLAKDSKNTLVVWRHRHPEGKDSGYVYGRNLHNEVKDGFINTYYRIFGGPEGSPEDNLQKLIKLKLENNDPIGVSKSFLIHKNKNGDIQRVISLEDSITYKPACKACKTTEVIQMEDIEKEIEVLQEQLNDTKLQLQDKEKALEEKENEISEIKETYATKLEELEAKIDTKETEKVTLEEKFVELNDKFNEFKKKALEAQKQPIIDEIYKYEQDEDLLDIYKTWDIEKLEDRKKKVIDKYNKFSIQTKTLEEEREEAKQELEQKDVGMSALRGMAKEDLDLARQIEQEMKEMGDI